MPYKPYQRAGMRNRKYPFKKKNAKRRVNKPLVSISRSPAAPYAFVRMRYSNGGTFNPLVSGDPADLRVVANGLFAPDVDLTTHQPIGFDQWMAFYEHYQVLGAKITATFSPTGTTEATARACVGVALLSDNTTITDLNQMRENGNVTWKYLTLQRDLVQVSKSFSSKKFFHLGPYDDTLRGNTVANPSEIAVFHIFAAPMEGSTEDPATINVNYVVEYYVKLSERKILTQS